MSYSYNLLVICFITFCFTSCVEDDCSEDITYILREPVIKSYIDVREAPVQFTQSRELEKPGKIYFFQNYVFINERYQGVHIIDNADTNNPMNIGFIEIEGNLDIAIRNGFLYADSYMDLLTIDISNIQSPKVTFRSEDIFNSHINFLQNEQFIAFYNESTVTEHVNCGETINFNSCPNCEIISTDQSFNRPEITLYSGSVNNTGTGGSFARFSISDEFLYALDVWQMPILNLRNPETPALQATIEMQFGVETLFRANDYLFVGANNGLYIYDNSTPGKPFYLSEFSHARACDPVVVDGNYAYVTLRSGNTCEGFNNQLDIVDISNIHNPFLHATFPMENPHGLAKFEDALYICEGKYGFKTFDARNPTEVGNALIHHNNSFHAYDVIALSNSHVMIIGDDGFYQYDISNPKEPVLLSIIPVSLNNS